MCQEQKEETPWVYFLIPNAISLLNGAIGVSLMLGYFEDNEMLMLLIAMMCDGLDGQIARRLNASSAFGAYLDDICDVFSWVLAPCSIAWRQETPPHFLVILIFGTSGFSRLLRFIVPVVTDNKKFIDSVGLPNVNSAAFPGLVYFTGLDTLSAALAWQCSHFNPWIGLILAVLMHVNLQFSVKAFGLCLVDWEMFILLLVLGIPQVIQVDGLFHFFLWSIFWASFLIAEPVMTNDSELKSKEGKQVRVLTTMVGDALHIGHVAHILKTRQLTEKMAKTENVSVVVGVHSNKVVQSYKRTPLYNLEERVAHMKECPGVDEVVPHAPLDLTMEYLNKHNIDFVAGNLMDGDSEAAKEYNSQYKIIIDLGRFINVPRMKGISTTDIIQRAVANNFAKLDRQAAAAQRQTSDFFKKCDLCKE